jgi:hypothetical protein
MASGCLARRAGQRPLTQRSLKPLLREAARPLA